MDNKEQYVADELKRLGLERKPLIDSPNLNILALSNIIQKAYETGYKKGTEWR